MCSWCFGFVKPHSLVIGYMAPHGHGAGLAEILARSNGVHSLFASLASNPKNDFGQDCFESERGGWVGQQKSRQHVCQFIQPLVDLLLVSSSPVHPSRYVLVCEWALFRRHADALAFSSQASLSSPAALLRGSWDLISRVISTFIKVISRYNYSYLTDNCTY